MPMDVLVVSMIGEAETTLTVSATPSTCSVSTEVNRAIQADLHVRLLVGLESTELDFHDVAASRDAQEPEHTVLIRDL